MRARYLAARNRGTEYLPPEVIRDTTPILRDQHIKRIKPVTPACIYRLIHNLYAKAGFIDVNKQKKRYRLRPHSIRKFFRTQLGSMSTLPTDYIEYMMGHTISTYNDIQMKGIEFLRSQYAAANLQIKHRRKQISMTSSKTFCGAKAMALTKPCYDKPL